MKDFNNQFYENSFTMYANKSEPLYCNGLFIPD